MLKFLARNIPQCNIVCFCIKYAVPCITLISVLLPAILNPTSVKHVHSLFYTAVLQR
jgi:hypothetical protein